MSVSIQRRLQCQLSLHRLLFWSSSPLLLLHIAGTGTVEHLLSLSDHLRHGYASLHIDKLNTGLITRSRFFLVRTRPFCTVGTRLIFTFSRSRSRIGFSMTLARFIAQCNGYTTHFRPRKLWNSVYSGACSHRKLFLKNWSSRTTRLLATFSLKKNPLVPPIGLIAPGMTSIVIQLDSGKI